MRLGLHGEEFGFDFSGGIRYLGRRKAEAVPLLGRLHGACIRVPNGKGTGRMPGWENHVTPIDASLRGLWVR